MNAPLEVIPEHLREYTTEQDPSLYTPIDQAVWRYVMRVSKTYFAEHGHPLYVQGIEATGMSTEKIPLISEMDEALRKMNWRAVAINGFIPPSVFFEFQGLRILAVNCDMRLLENIGYTSSPDIIHEAAGHAPIVADPEYRKYLEAYGEVARNSIISKYDMDLYQAIFELSEIKEKPHATAAEIAVIQKNFETLAAKETTPSEAAVLGRMGWWTTEYGLIEKDGKLLIYGAGLLSAVTESYNCLKPEVKKIPFHLETVLQTKYDITRPQPQLFVIKSFEQLTHALEEFAKTMAFRRGGTAGLQIAKTAENTVTLVLDGGIQVTGIVQDFEKSESDEETLVTLTGTKQISFHDQASEVFSSALLPQKLFIPLFEKNVVSASTEDIQRKLHGSGLHTKAGYRIKGRFKKELRIGSHGKILVLENVTILDQDEKTLFQENQKQFPLFLASKVTSVFGGAADRTQFALKSRSRSKKVLSHISNLTPANKSLNDLYQIVRTFREQKLTNLSLLDPVILDLNEKHQNDWLLRLELYELFVKLNSASVHTAQLKQQLLQIADRTPELKDMINRGIEGAAQ